MRSLAPHFLNDPAFAEWQEGAKRAREKLLQAVAAGKNPADHFSPSVWQKFKNNFLVQHHAGKCAFCEGRHISGEPGDAEHFRPKGAPTQDRQPVNGHTGYYWLAYEWQNLFLACSYCNGPHTCNYSTLEKHPGKHIEFPVRAHRVTAPGPDPAKWWEELKAEHPLLLHPYNKDKPPETHFDAGIAGALIGISPEGRATIEICDLNRVELMAAREAEELRAITRLNRSLEDLGQKPSWFTPADPFSLYLNLRMRALTAEQQRKYAEVPF